MASQAFTSLSLITLMTMPLLEFVQAVPALIQCVGCFQRIENHLERSATTRLPPISALTDETVQQSENAEKLPSMHPVVSFEDADITWSSDSKVVFRDLTLEIGTGTTMITGPVGSGKSALIRSILGEMAVTKGFVRTTFGNIAYCPQVPWIVDNTIRQNITGGTQFDAEWYDFAVSACGLEDDFRYIPAGDMHVAGSNGASLSGGQKQRVVGRVVVDALDDETDVANMEVTGACTGHLL